MVHCILFTIHSSFHLRHSLILLLLLGTVQVASAKGTAQDPTKDELNTAIDSDTNQYKASSGLTTNNWAVVLSSSRYWHNYRHGSNALSFYHLLKDCGLLDDQIILLMAENYACDPRNHLPGTVYNDPNKDVNLYGCDAHIDIQGNEVSSQSYKGVLQGRYSLSTPLSRRLLSTNNSNVFIYITGHGNKGLIKFHDTETFTATELADTVAFMHSTGRFHKMLLIVDSCNAASMCMEIRSPNVVCIGSSSYEENSFSHHGDEVLGIEVIDAFGYEMVQAFDTNVSSSASSLRPRAEGARSSASVAKSRYSPLLNRSINEIFGSMHIAHPSIFGAINDPKGSLENWKLGEFFSPRYYYGSSRKEGGSVLKGKDIIMRNVFD